MKRGKSLAIALIVFFASVCAQAQNTAPFLPNPAEVGPVPGPEGEVTNEPVCFTVENHAPYTVFGSFLTDKYITPEGVSAHHRSNFRLKSKEQAEFCTYGPFYEGQRLEMTLRTLVPVFSCKTALTRLIVIYGRIKPEGGTETWAECL